MLAEVQPEVVALAVPTVAHLPLTIQAAEAGVRGICCEKPVATNLADARAMADACARSGAQEALRLLRHGRNPVEISHRRSPYSPPGSPARRP